MAAPKINKEEMIAESVFPQIFDGNFQDLINSVRPQAGEENCEERAQNLLDRLRQGRR